MGLPVGFSVALYVLHRFGFWDISLPRLISYKIT